MPLTPHIDRSYLSEKEYEESFCASVTALALTARILIISTEETEIAK
jgi:hypothetical protein